MTPATPSRERGETRSDLHEAKVLRFLALPDSAGYFTAGYLVREAGLGATRSLMATARINVIEPMAKKGWLDRMDACAQHPAAYRLSIAGRAVANSNRTPPATIKEPGR